MRGTLIQTFVSLPQAIPVTFTAAGPWHVDLSGWSAKPVQGSTSLDVIVTTASLLGPSVDGPPRILTRDPAGQDTGVEPAVILKLTFNEPVLPSPVYRAGPEPGHPLRHRAVRRKGSGCSTPAIRPNRWSARSGRVPP